LPESGAGFQETDMSEAFKSGAAPVLVPDRQPWA
jgi:hypothetical protein